MSFPFTHHFKGFKPYFESTHTSSMENRKNAFYFAFQKNVNPDLSTDLLLNLSCCAAAGTR